MDLSALRDAIASAELPAAGPDLMLALDADGTILHHDTTLSDRVREAIDAHREAGTHVVLATGRGLQPAHIVLAQLEINTGFAVMSNGAMTVQLGADSPIPAGISVPDTRFVVDNYLYTVLATRTFDPTAALEIIHSFLPDALFAVESVGEPRRLNAPFPAGELSGTSVLVPFEELAVPDALRLTVRDPFMDPLTMLELFKRLGLNGVEYAVGWTAWMDVSPAGVSKGAALEDVRRWLGVAPGATVAVGDGGNDVSMLAWAGCGVAMGDASPYVRDAARTVTDTADNDGLAFVLEALLER